MSNATQTAGEFSSNGKVKASPDLSILAEDILGEVGKILNSEVIPHSELLKRLLDQICEVNFEILIRPGIKKLEDKSEEIEKRLVKEDGSIKNDETLRIELKEIQSRINKLRSSIREKHYVVCIISELLKVTKQNKWNLCKCYDYVFIYNGAFWRQYNKEDLKYFLGQVAVKFGYPEIDAMHHSFKDELQKQFLAQAHLPTPEIDTKKTLINLQNGTAEFKDGKLNFRSFSPEDFLTYQLPFDYNPRAKYPMFESYLNKVLPDVESCLVLQEFAAYIFTKLNLEKCLVLTGGGSNGKSVFFNILTSLVGKENCLHYGIGLFKHEYNRSKLVSVLLNYSSEKGADLDTETFKNLVSCEPVQAREPYGKPFTLYNTAKFIMNANELPKETESTEAYFRRYIIIPFDVTIPESERDITLADKIITSELPGVFNWILIGLERLIENRKFTESPKVAKALAEFKRQADNVALFIDENSYKPESTEKIPLAILYVRYKEFCVENGYKHYGKNNFSNKLESKGFEKCRLNDGSAGFLIKSENLKF